MKDSRDSFVLYTEYKKLFKKLTAKETQQVLMAIFDYVENGEEPAGLTDKADIVWLTIQNSLDRNRDKYDKKCAQNRENGAKGGRPPKTQKNRTVIKETEQFITETQKTLNDSERDSDSDSDNERDSERERDSELATPTLSPTRFQNPTIEEVKKVAAELGFDEKAAEKFFYHYQANGWTQGRSKPVIDWVAQLNSWMAREGDFERSSEDKQKASYREREYSKEQLDALFDDLDRVEF